MGRCIALVLLSSLPLLVTTNNLVGASSCPETYTSTSAAAAGGGGGRITTTLDFDSPPAIESGSTFGSVRSYCGFDFRPPPLVVDCANSECFIPGKESVLFFDKPTTIARTDRGTFSLESFQFYNHNASVTELHFSFTTQFSQTEIGPIPLPFLSDNGEEAQLMPQFFDMSNDIASVTLIPTCPDGFAFSLSSLKFSYDTP
ncbi:unnamed protein product [Cylindrotheca closterium]|uniref:Uncharacterized protein n=1 Tax=Cylindrotheca closterium TaxID=2856 RepID=A0AAD2CUM4_9STRA|nr:unnamed protein product [Cylindrotheca closterium]